MLYKSIITNQVTENEYLIIHLYCYSSLYLIYNTAINNRKTDVMLALM